MVQDGELVDMGWASFCFIRALGTPELEGEGSSKSQTWLSS